MTNSPKKNRPKERLNLTQRLKTAARLLITGVPPSRLAAEQAQRREIPAITLEEVAEIRQFFPLEKFFIFGHARSGTTLLARLVRLHPQVHCNWQFHPFTRPPLLRSLVADPAVGEWLSRRSNRWNHGRDLSPLVLRAASDFVLEREARALGKRIVGDKSPSSLLDGQAVQLLHDVYPDARLIYIVRDGRDTVLSHRFQAFIDSPQHLSAEDLRLRQDFIDDPAPFLAGERSIFTEKGLQQAALGWVRNVTETEQAGKTLFGDHYLSLRYEDLLADPYPVMRRIWDFLQADSSAADELTLQEAVQQEMQSNPDADWQKEKAGEIAQALRKGQQGSWRQMFTPQDRQIFQQLAEATLLAWDYPPTQEAE